MNSKKKLFEDVVQLFLIVKRNKIKDINKNWAKKGYQNFNLKIPNQLLMNSFYTL